MPQRVEKTRVYRKAHRHKEREQSGQQRCPAQMQTQSHRLGGLGRAKQQ